MPPSNMRRVSLLAEKLMTNEQDGRSEAKAESSAGTAGRRRSSDQTEKQQQQHMEPSKAEFLDYLSKLIESVEWTLDHVEGDTLLPIPELLENLEASVTDAELAKNQKITQQLEEIVLSWEKHIKRVSYYTAIQHIRMKKIILKNKK